MKKSIFALAFLILILPLSVRAEGFDVDSFDDMVDINPGDGKCETSLTRLSVCTLRAAIMETNAFDGDDTISLPAGTYNLSIDGILEDDAATGDLDIADNLTIVGDSAETTIIDGGAIDHVFHILTADRVFLGNLSIQNGYVHVSGEKGGAGILDESSGDVTLYQVTVRSNLVDWGLNDEYACGGGIRSTSAETFTIYSSEISGNAITSTEYEVDGGGICGTTFIIYDSVISDNEARSDSSSGGGIYADTVQISDSIVTGNMLEVYSTASGGGISVSESILVTNSTISENEVRVYAQGAGFGGGISSSGTIIVSGSSITGNVLSAESNGSSYGGGLFNNDSMSVTNSTISANIVNSLVRSYGGGIFALGDTFIISSSTVADNSLSGEEMLGSGVYLGTGDITNSIIADNLIESEQDGDCYGSVTSLSHSIIEHFDEDDCTITSGTPIEKDPRLKNLSYNGASTQTHAIQRLSPAYNAGDCTTGGSSSLTTDQRGDGFLRTIGAACDIGAYELQSIFSLPEEDRRPFPWTP